jgi:hypothetical protein
MSIESRPHQCAKTTYTCDKCGTTCIKKAPLLPTYPAEWRRVTLNPDAIYDVCGVCVMKCLCKYLWMDS